MYCIISDGHLRDSLSLYEGISTYESLSRFVQDKVVRELIAKLGPSELWAATLSTLLKQLPASESEITEELGDAFTEDLLWKTVTHPIIPDDNNEGMINIVYEIQEIEFAWKSIIDYGPGLLAIPFKARVPVTIAFAVYRGDAYDVPDGVSLDTQDMLNDHYYEAEGSIEVNIQGYASAKFDLEEFGDDDLPKLEQIGVHQIDEIEPIEQEPGTIFQVPIKVPQ